jgi:hypothetical protein
MIKKNEFSFNELNLSSIGNGGHQLKSKSKGDLFDEISTTKHNNNHGGKFNQMILQEIPHHRK